jgi:hypothetical protein
MGLFRNSSRAKSGCRVRNKITPQHLRGGAEMLKKLSLVLSVLAALGFAVAISAPADAKEPDKKVQVNKNIQVNKNLQVNKNVKFKQNLQVNKNIKFSKFKVGQKVNGHIWFGHNRHRWHNRWYAYGEGPCWINFEDEWFWNELVCPF